MPSVSFRNRLAVFFCVLGRWGLLPLGVLALAAPLVLAQQGQPEDSGFFYETLAPYGDWLEVPGYGICWRPEVSREWAPYTEGYWAYTDAGWTWVSQEPFGAVVFHYGRWLASNVGWLWVPGYEWGPAWVSWRTNNDYLGWAPLPPQIPWFPQRGISAWVDVHCDIGPGYYRFCPVRDFGAPYISDVLVPVSRNTAIIQRTQNVTNITLYNGNVFCGGPRYDWIRSRSARPVPVLRVVREENVSRYRGLEVGGGASLLGYVHEDLLVLPAPSRVRPLDSRRFQSPLSVWTGSLSRGWSGEESRQREVRAHFQRDWDDSQAAGVGTMGAVSAQETRWIPQPASTGERSAAFHADLPKTPLAHPSTIRSSVPTSQAPTSAGSPVGGVEQPRVHSNPGGSPGGRAVSAAESPVSAVPVFPGLNGVSGGTARPHVSSPSAQGGMGNPAGTQEPPFPRDFHTPARGDVSFRQAPANFPQPVQHQPVAPEPMLIHGQPASVSNARAVVVPSTNSGGGSGGGAVSGSERAPVSHLGNSHSQIPLGEASAAPARVQATAPQAPATFTQPIQVQRVAPASVAPPAHAQTPPQSAPTNNPRPVTPSASVPAAAPAGAVAQPEDPKHKKNTEPASAGATLNVRP